MSWKHGKEPFFLKKKENPWDFETQTNQKERNITPGGPTIFAKTQEKYDQEL